MKHNDPTRVRVRRGRNRIVVNNNLCNQCNITTEGVSLNPTNDEEYSIQ